MDRRKFVKSTLLSAPVIGSSLNPTGMTHPFSSTQQWYELRTYIFSNETQHQLTATYLEQAYLPALNRAGLKNIGVFTELQSPSATPSPAPIARTFLLIPFPSIESFTGLGAKLSRDGTYTSAAAPYLSADPKNPAYDRIDSSLLKAFAHMPQLEAPEKKEGLFELRCYESPTEAAGQKKIEMFNEKGEIDIFKKIGARPVFFGETLIGQKRPNLTYMLCFDDMAAHDAHWKAFGSDPEWKKISSDPDYVDAKLISKITRTFLHPAPGSQI